MKKLIMVTALALASVLALVGCGGNPAAQQPSQAASESAAASEPAVPSESAAAPDEAVSGKVQMSGSTSMETIANALKEAFMDKYPDVTVDVQLGGSSVGVKDVQEGKSDIGNVSRALKADETGLKENKMAIDGIAIVVNPANKVTEISKEDLAKVYTGEINNWKDLGGDDQPIVVIGREASSGTRGAFEELLDVAEKCKYAQELNETGAVKTAVSATPAAIGYVSLEALDDTVTALNVDGAPATEEAIKANEYPLSRPFLMVTAEGELRPEVQAFLDFVMGEEGQAIVADNKLITIS
ncbi:phosphate ABC transporter substrate-binding protein [Christensenella timonensis]|uniref:phosphate ABC transporter substrate-binding protein n=1 Tax=Christensenella timonensis TaxID=1816678 RepID=UPI000835CEAA|nr:phosphate ABC transporter substrate-binding protein [Christensenella timonensis]